MSCDFIELFAVDALRHEAQQNIICASVQKSFADRKGKIHIQNPLVHFIMSSRMTLPDIHAGNMLSQILYFYGSGHFASEFRQVIRKWLIQIKQAVSDSKKEEWGEIPMRSKRRQGK